MSVMSGLLIVSAMTLFSWLAVAGLRLYSIKKQWLDLPAQRSSHHRAIPNIGGISILLTILITIIFLWFVNLLQVTEAALWLAVLLGLGITGFIDDRSELPISIRLSVQLIVAVLVVSIVGGIQAIDLGIVRIEFKWLSYLLGAIWVVGFINMYNFMDGINGLAGSQGLISGLVFALWFYHFADLGSVWICLAIASGALGFLYWNITPARIFMGDAGSTVLGGSFALISLELHNQYAVPIIFCAAVFAWFLIDSGYTFIVRLVAGKPVWLPHREHIYQKLAPGVESHTKVTGVICVVTLIISTIASIILLR